MAWLLNDEEVLASVGVARDLLGRICWPKVLTDGPVAVLRGGLLTHSFGAPSEVLVVSCDKEMVVVSLRACNPNRLIVHSYSVRWVILAPMELGRLWPISVGDHLELRVSTDH